MLGLTLLLLSSLVICGEYLRYVYIPRRKKRLFDRILSDYAGSKRRRFLSARVYGWNIILVCPVDRGQRGTSRAREDEERENIFSLRRYSRIREISLGRVARKKTLLQENGST